MLFLKKMRHSRMSQSACPSKYGTRVNGKNFKPELQGLRIEYGPYMLPQCFPFCFSLTALPRLQFRPSTCQTNALAQSHFDPLFAFNNTNTQ